MGFKSKKIRPERVWVAPEFKSMLYELKAQNPSMTMQDISKEIAKNKDKFQFKKLKPGDFFVKI